VQCYGKEASDFTKKNLTGATVKLEADPAGDNRDKYDRLLRYVYLQDGTLWNQRLIDQGYGFAYLSFQFSKQADFASSQAKAKDAKLGLWTTCTPVLSSGGRWQSNDLR
jgi:micrococcal nuclease